MSSRVEELLEEAVSKLRREADGLQEAISVKEAAFRKEVDPLRKQLAELEAAIARVRGRDLGRTPSGRVPRGQNRRAILDALDTKQGLTAAEVAEATGISKPTVRATLAKLSTDGLVVKRRDGRGVEHTLA